jgi:regulatory protein
MGPRKPQKLEFQPLLDYALRSLGARSYSAGELRKKLERRAETADDIPRVLERLKEYGYVDDRRYAESVASSQLVNHGLGKARVLNNLRKRRVAPAIAEQAVAQAYKDTDEIGLIEAFMHRKYRNVKLNEFLAETKNLASAYRRLRMAGFTSANSVRVLKRFAREAEELDGLEE